MRAVRASLAIEAATLGRRLQARPFIVLSRALLPGPWKPRSRVTMPASEGPMGPLLSKRLGTRAVAQAQVRSHPRRRRIYAQRVAELRRVALTSSGSSGGSNVTDSRS